VLAFEQDRFLGLPSVQCEPAIMYKNVYYRQLLKGKQASNKVGVFFPFAYNQMKSCTSEVRKSSALSITQPTKLGMNDFSI
jgi:hypothetical protein